MNKLTDFLFRIHWILFIFLMLFTHCISMHSVYETTKEEGRPTPFLGIFTGVSGLAYSGSKGDIPWFTFFLIDLPFTIVADTALLPIVAPWYFVHSSISDSQKKNDLEQEEQQAINQQKQILANGGHSNSIQATAFSPDSSKILTSDGATLKLWDMSGHLIKTIPAPYDITTLAYDPRGQLFIAGTKKAEVLIWDIKGRLLKSLQGHSKAIHSIVFSPDGRLFATCSQNNSTRLWTRSGKAVATINIWNKSNAMAFNGRGNLFAISGRSSKSDNYDYVIQVWNTNGKLLRKWDGHSLALKFMPGDMLISVNDGRIFAHIFDYRKSEPAYTKFLPPGEIVERAHIIASNRMVGCFLTHRGARGESCRLFNQHGEVLNVFYEEDMHSWSVVALSPDGRLLAISIKNVLTIWHINDPKNKSKIPDINRTMHGNQSHE